MQKATMAHRRWSCVASHRRLCTQPGCLRTTRRINRFNRLNNSNASLDICVAVYRVAWGYYRFLKKKWMTFVTHSLFNIVGFIFKPASYLVFVIVGMDVIVIVKVQSYGEISQFEWVSKAALSSTPRFTPGLRSEINNCLSHFSLKAW